MSRTLRFLRASITAGAVLMAFGASHAADVAEQRVALAYTHASDATARKAAMPMRQAAAARIETTVAKAPVRRAPAHGDARDSDGSRFIYDSCGCSN